MIYLYDRTVKLDLEKELIIDLSGSSSDEWIITTDPNHIFYFSFLTNDENTIDEQQKEEIQSSLTVKLFLITSRN